FRNETLQARVDLLMQEMAGWRGAVSVEVTHSDFEAIGEEAFTPPAKTESYAIALMEEKHIGDVLVQLGARVEQVSIKADPIEWEDHHAEDDADSHTLQHFDDMEFTPISLSAGLVWEFTPGYNAGISLTHAQRAPSAAELFSYGPHIGSGAFEVGAVFDLHAGDHPHFHYHDDVTEEVSNNIDLSLRKHAGNIAWVLNFFYNEIDDFYYQQSTGYSSGD
ncbi:MAG: TonB-dependent receptor, partial [Spongiibacter sp.]